MPLPGLPLTKQRSALPGLNLTLGFSVLYLSIIVLLPLSAVLAVATGQSWSDTVSVVTSPRVLAAFRLSIAASLLAALTNACFGLVAAWVLVRYRFPGRRVIDALVDLPFALPTAVAGIALAAITSEGGWIGRWLAPLGIRIAFTEAGVWVAMVFIGLPFVVRTVQPVLEAMEPGIEEAAASLGATRWQTFARVLLPSLMPAVAAGFAMAFARALGEYGSIVFISGNLPMRTEILPLLIMSKLEQFDYRGASALASAMLAASFAVLLAINTLQRRMVAVRAG